MEIDRPDTPTLPGPAAPKRSWVTPAVLELGSMRQLTLLQGGSIGGECDPDVDPDCGFG
jgi:hypothetical protein